MLPLTSYSLSSSVIETYVTSTEYKNIYVPANHEDLVSGKKAKDFNQLIDYVREAEQKLIENGYKDVDERIHIIRGIYYGTPWSVDYSVEGNRFRNGMFNRYTYSKEPDDPRKVLGQTLFKNLFESAEVYQDSTKGFRTFC